MICFIALIVFGILGIFSATHRKIAAEAFDCVFKRITLRKCDTGLDTRLKAQITGTLHRKNPNLARHLFRNFEVYSWILLILMILSLGYSVFGLYNYALYGNCNGAGSDDFCVYDSLTGKSQVSDIQSGMCVGPSPSITSELSTPDLSAIPAENIYSIQAGDDPVITLIEFGCYACPYTRKAQPTIERVLKDFKGKVSLAYLDFPITSHEESMMLSQAVHCAGEQGKKWEFHFTLLEEEDIPIMEDILSMAEKHSLDISEFQHCMAQDYNDIAAAMISFGKAHGIYGTPTFFVGDAQVVGPKPLLYFKNIINKEMR